ncbi:tetratricopeptide repeat protein, partial [Elusimicrobiota bacterium]
MNKRKIVVSIAATVLIFMCLLCYYAEAESSFKGQLADKDGNPITANQSLIFKLFARGIPEPIKVILKESVTPNSDGIYNVKLDLDDLADLEISGDIFIEVETESRQNIINRSMIRAPARNKKKRAKKAKSKVSENKKNLTDDDLFDLLKTVTPKTDEPASKPKSKSASKPKSKSASKPKSKSASKPVSEPAKKIKGETGKAELSPDTGILKREYFGKGHALFSQKKYKESIEYFEKLLELDPDH